MLGFEKYVTLFKRVGKQVEDEMHRQKAELLGDSNASSLKLSMETVQNGSLDNLQHDAEHRNEGMPLLMQQVDCLNFIVAYRSKFTIC